MGATVGQTSDVGMTGAEVVAKDGTDVEGLAVVEGAVDEGTVEVSVEGVSLSKDIMSTDV